MRVGIFTFARACNYGAALQAYALQTVLERMGHEVEIADYTPRRIRNGGRPIPPPPFSRHPRAMLRDFSTWFRNLPGQFRHLELRRRRQLSLESFQRGFIKFSPPIRGTLPQSSSWDAIVAGSDQVWNIGLTNGIDHFYWGLAFPEHVRCVAYAVSAGGSLHHVASSPACHAAVRRFAAVGVREAELKTALGDSLPRESPVVLDPVLLLSETDWRKVERRPDWIGETPYALLYRVADSLPAKCAARRWAQVRGVRLVEICIGENYPQHENEFYGIAPAEFVWLFDHAETVVAASFHGTAFSILFGKPFLAFGAGAPGDGRIKDLLNVAGVPDHFRVEDMGDVFPESASIDLRQQFDESFRFLEKAFAP